MFLRLFSFAPRTSIQPVGFLRSLGTSILSSPLRYLPVIERGDLIKSSTVPSPTSSPPFTPAPGPMSTI